MRAGILFYASVVAFDASRNTGSLEDGNSYPFHSFAALLCAAGRRDDKHTGNDLLLIRYFLFRASDLERNAEQEGVSGVDEDSTAVARPAICLGHSGI